MNKFFTLAVILIAFGPATGCASDIYNQSSKRTEARGLGQFSSYKPAERAHATMTHTVISESYTSSAKPADDDVDQTVLIRSVTKPSDRVRVTVVFDSTAPRGRSNNITRTNNCDMFVSDADRLGGEPIPCKIRLAGTEPIVIFDNEAGKERHLYIKDMDGQFDRQSRFNQFCRTVGIERLKIPFLECNARGRNQVAYSTHVERDLLRGF